MPNNFKGDLINSAFSRMRISGLTVSATPEEMILALERLEDMASEWDGVNICTGYNFEDDPDINSLHNLDRKYWQAYKTNLAVRMFPDFGKGMNPDQTLLREASAAYSVLASLTAMVRPAQYPSRMPRGSGSSRMWNRWRKYYYPVDNPPISCATNKMYIGDTNDFVEHFDAYLEDSETVVSYTIEADTGLTIDSDSLSTPDIIYRITATGGTDGVTGRYQVKMVATTSNSRVTTRVIDFELRKA